VRHATNLDVLEIDGSNAILDWLPIVAARTAHFTTA
jgi:hypothetical protein